MSIFKNNPENKKKNVIRDGVHIKRNRRLIAIGLGLTVATIVGIVLLVTVTPRDLGEVEVVAPPVTTVDPALQPLIVVPAVETSWEDLTDEEKEEFIEETIFTEDEVYTEESWNIMLDEHCSDGHCDDEHLAQHHADGQVEETPEEVVEEVVETTVPATTVPAVTTTTMPTTETTAPPVTTPPTTTVAPAPTTTAPPADPVEACIQDLNGCLNPAVHSYINVAWTIADFNPPFPTNGSVPDEGWYGGCQSSECTAFPAVRARNWLVSEKPSFADFTTFANNWCPVNPGQENNDVFKAYCNSGHSAGGDYEVKWSAGDLSVKWYIGVAEAPGYASWSDWYRGTH